MDHESGGDDERAHLDEYVRWLRQIVAALVAREGGHVVLTAVELDEPRDLEFSVPGHAEGGLVVRITSGPDPVRGTCVGG